MAKQELTVNVRLSFWHGTGERRATLEVTDSVSGLSFMEIELGPEALYGLLSGSGTKQVPGELRGIERVNQIRETKQVEVPTISGDPISGREVPEWVEQTPPPEEGFEYAGAHRTNRRTWNITFVRWHTPDAEERAAHLADRAY